MKVPNQALVALALPFFSAPTVSGAFFPSVSTASTAAQSAFAPPEVPSKYLAATTETKASCECEGTLDDATGALDFVSQKGSADVLRSIFVTGADGRLVRLGDAMGDNGPSVVVFLRHLGCPYCWSYAKDWCELQQRLEDEGVSGPIFVSIGDEGKLNKFLDLNPHIPRDSAFVDDMERFDAYNTIGFGRFDEADKEDIKNVKLSPPEMGGFGGWWRYLSNVMSISPIPDGKMGEVPEGVLRLGGTFVVNGKDVVYQWNDKLPGDHPVPQEIFAEVIDANRIEV